MCMAGQLKHPNSLEMLQKRTQVLTTSRIMWRTLQQYQCVGHHRHDVIAGSCKPANMHRMPLSQYTELYTAMFGRRLSRAIQCSIQVSEIAVGSRTEFLLTSNVEDEAPEPKRRRLHGKTKDVPIEEPAKTPTRRDRLKQLIHMADKCAPRVGKVILREGPLFQAIQETYPEKQLVAIDICRGINRKRTCKIGPKGTTPYRRAFGKQRTDLEVFEESEWEAWEVLSGRQQIRTGIPSKLLVTMFATQKRAALDDQSRGPAKMSKSEVADELPEAVSPNTQDDIPNMTDATVLPQIPENSQQQQDTQDTKQTLSQHTTTETTISHGPKFRQLSAATQTQIKKIHQNLGHPDNRVLQLALKRAGWPLESIQGCADFQCSVCSESQRPKTSRPGHLTNPKDFNDQVSFDGAEWQSPEGHKFQFYHFIDTATNFHIAVPYFQRTTEGLIDAFSQAWLRWAGPPKSLLFDSATEANSAEFARFLQEHSVESFVIPTEAHWQLGRAERHGATLKHMLDRYHQDRPITTQEEFDQSLIQLCNAKNSMSRHEGYTPELWVLGKMKSIPGSNCSNAPDSASYAGLDDQSPEGQRFQVQLARREAARLAFVKADHSSSLRRALHARSRPDRNTFHPGDLVMYWRAGKGVEDGSWHGPARVLMTEGANLVWISHLTSLYRCAPEHVRQLSSDEYQSISPEERQQSLQLPAKCGTGVFQFQELSQQIHPTSNTPDPHIPIAIDQIATTPPNIPIEPVSNTPPSSVAQPDDEPENLPEVPASNEVEHENDIPGMTMSGDQAVNVPVPDETDDELVADHRDRDRWEVVGRQLIRHHDNIRIQTLFPFDAWKCPVDLEEREDYRKTTGTFQSGVGFSREETWKNNVQAALPQPEPWTGKTIFHLKRDIAEINHVNFQDNYVQDNYHNNHPITYAEIFLTLDDFQKCLGKTYEYQEAYLASQAKRQKIEVKTRELNQEDKDLFNKAKDKELESWLATDTVRRILRSQVPEGQLLRSRWVLTWKPLDDIEQKETGMSRKAKARLVILGYEDPLIDSLPRDSPTLGRDSRMLALQCIASHRWTARSFDIKTAFLRGSRQDSRILGVEPPQELRLKMKLQDTEVCELLKGAYGLINAPLLWYVELKNALLALGFLISPLDPCLFVLPKRNTKSNDTTHIHGVLGIHVDDGIGGGDEMFRQTIQALERKYPFGSKRQGSFTFTGVQVHQEHNGEIHLSQKDYINDIPPINIPKNRRQEPQANINKQELQDLRGLTGSLQYAATNTRPDLSCRLSLLQAKVTCATVADLQNGNRLLNDAKNNAGTSIKIKPLAPDKVRFLSFSDAAFATREKAHSQKGCLILATTEEIDQIKSSDVSPLVWFSKKINRVVSSTLASETYALSGALDTLSWIRIHWAWILNPQLHWKNPEETLKMLPQAFAVVDCKSLFDLLQKTSIPQCSEYRTMLEALVIKDRLKEGVIIKWVHSAAQMADSLTKDMDTTVLRSFLEKGKCILHDVDEILKQRADKKVRQQWYQQTSSLESALHVFALCLIAADELSSNP